MTEPSTTETSPPAAAASPIPYRTATIVTLSVASLLFVAFFVSNRVVFGADVTGEDRTTAIYLVILALSIACFVVSLVLRSRTKRLGLPRGLANAAVAVSSCSA